MIMITKMPEFIEKEHIRDLIYTQLIMQNNEDEFHQLFNFRFSAFRLLYFINMMFYSCLIKTFFIVEHTVQQECLTSSDHQRVVRQTPGVKLYMIICEKKNEKSVLFQNGGNFPDFRTTSR